MSTQPQLSPLEQLGASVNSQPTIPSQAPRGNLSPLEQLGEDVQKQQAAQPPPLADGAVPYVPNARIRNLTVDPTKDTHSGTEAFFSGAKTGTELAAIPASLYAAALHGPAEAFAESPAGKALLDVVTKYGIKPLVAGAGLGIGHEAFQ